MKKSLLNKLKLGLAAAGIAGFSYFNSLNAQTTAQAQTITQKNYQSNKNYVSKYNTTTHYIIKEIQKESPIIDLKILDNLIYQSKKIIKEDYKNDPYNTENSQKLMEKIGNLVEKELPFYKESHPCYKRSLTYLAIAEENKLPLYPVMIPNHMFVRWDPDGIHKQWGYNNYSKEEQLIFDEAKNYLTLEKDPKSNKGDFNWDPTFLKSFDNYFYEYFFSCDKTFGNKEIKEGIYLKNLNKKELLSYTYSEESIHSMMKNKYHEALILADKSLELNQKNIIAYDTKGDILYSIGKNCEKNCEKYFEESIKNFEKANEFTDNWSVFKSEYYSKIGWTLKSLEKYGEAEKNFNKAVYKEDIYREKDETIERIYKNKQKEFLLERLRFYLITNQNEKAKKDLIIYSNLEGLRITEHAGKTIYVKSNELRGQLSNWKYAEEKCKNLDYLDSAGGEWRLPLIEELESIYKTKELTNLEYGNSLLWSSTKDPPSEKKMLVKDMKTGEIYKVSKNIDYYHSGFSKIQINSVCIKTMEKWDIDKMLAEQKKNLLEKNYPEILYKLSY